MGLTKQYLRYCAGEVFNVIASTKSNVLFLNLRETSGRYVAVGACERVVIWDLRTGEKVSKLCCETNGEVKVLAKSSDDRHLAVGYEDGYIRIFDLQTCECTITFKGHKSTVTCLDYDSDGTRLVSGSNDTEIVIWDVINENGLFRLRGHKGPITRCKFLGPAGDILVSSSKDTFIKFWDLNVQHCFKTVVGHRSEIWDFAIGLNDQRIITGSSDSELRFWDLTFREDTDDEKPKIKVAKPSSEEGDDEDSNSDILWCKKVGSVLRQSRDKVSSIKTDGSRTIFACHGNSGLLEVFRFLTKEELKRKIAKKQKKLKKKQQQSSSEPDAFNQTEISVELTPEEEVTKVGVLKIGSKIKSFDVIVERNTAKFVLLLSNNSLRTYEVDFGAEATSNSFQERCQIMTCGHRSDVRSVCFSSDSTAILSASGDSVKVWNRATQQCVRTILCDYTLTSIFVPGDRHAVIGTKSGYLQILDIASGQSLEEVQAHQGAVWSVCLFPDQRGFVSGSADKEVKFWEFELVTASNSSSKRLSIVHTRTLQLSEDVLSVRLSQDGRLIAVSLLDSTVKVFFVDTLKFFLSLYGHKLPVLCMDISDDSTLIVTGSADRNVKIWGLDFGDCHRSLFAHDDSIMCLQFIPKTHMFLTGGKDGLVKQWDADNFERITTLKGHHSEVWSLAVSPNGQYIVSASHDKSLRIWEKTDEILVLEEEKEMEREAEFEESLASKEETVIPGETNTEAGMATKKTAVTVKSAEKLMESLDIYKEETLKLAIYKAECLTVDKPPLPPTHHSLMLAYKTPTPEHFVLHVLKQIKSSELEEALLVLPFAYVTEFLTILQVFLEKRWSVELSCRCLFFLLRVHHNQITANQVLLSVLDRLRTTATTAIKEIRDSFGYNLAGLRFIQKEFESKEEVQLFLDATQKLNKKKQKRRKKDKLVERAILTL